MIKLGFFIFAIFIATVLQQRQICDKRPIKDFKEGLIGKSGNFPWLGVLKVVLEEEPLRLATTGLVLVHRRFAVASAREMPESPRVLLERNSSAMFIPRSGEPWHLPLVSFVFHPEFQNTPNTIALLELAQNVMRPLIPGCWPEQPFNNTHQLYVVGYTTENVNMKKMVYRALHVRQSLCSKFYDRDKDKMSIPVHYECVVGANFTKECTWDGGMALVSNLSGVWTVLGLSTRGPGCAEPARFIDLHPYVGWITEATSPTRKSADKNVSRDGESPKSYPLSQMDGRRVIQYEAEQIPWVIDHIGNNAIQIRTFDDIYEESKNDCAEQKMLAYREKMRIVDYNNPRKASATYRITMYDLALKGYTCIKVRVSAYKRSKVTMYYKLQLDRDEVNATDIFHAPDYLLKGYQLGTRFQDPRFNYNQGKRPGYDLPGWQPGPYLGPRPVTADPRYAGFKNLNLLLHIVYAGNAFMELKVYGPRRPPEEQVTLEPTTSKPTTTEYITPTPTYLKFHPPYYKPTWLDWHMNKTFGWWWWSITGNVPQRPGSVKGK